MKTRTTCRQYGNEVFFTVRNPITGGLLVEFSLSLYEAAEIQRDLTVILLSDSNNKDIDNEQKIQVDT